MEVVNPNAAYLSNFEVLEVLEEIKKKMPRSSDNEAKKHNKNELATITYETIKYLEAPHFKRHTPEKIKGFLEAVAPFKLAKCEKLNLINLCPKSALDIQVMVDESIERLGYEIQPLLEVVSQHLRDGEPIVWNEVAERAIEEENS